MMVQMLAAFGNSMEANPDPEAMPLEWAVGLRLLLEREKAQKIAIRHASARHGGGGGGGGGGGLQLLLATMSNLIPTRGARDLLEEQESENSVTP